MLPQVANTIFNGTHLQDAQLHVPESAMTDYWIAAPWNGFGHVLAEENVAETMAKTTATSRQADTVIYDLTGRPLQVPPSQGVYIKNQTKRIAP